MPANLAFNYMPQTNAAGTFNVTSTGYVQGEALDDPAIRYQLRGGVLSSAENIPMWGGVGISETVTPNTGVNAPDSSQGGLITRATNVGQAGQVNCLTGFSTFAQAHAMAISPQSNVPLAGSGMQVMFFRLGCGIVLPVACSPALTSLQGGPISPLVSWDFGGQQLIPYQPAYVSATAATGTYNTATGILALTFATAPNGTAPTVGGTYTVSGITGTGNAAQLNGTWPLASSGTSGTVLNLQATPGLGAITINAGTGTLASGGGALLVRVQEIVIGNCMTVSYSSATNYANWNYNGNVALIQL